jgi:hypothetical protein
MSRHFVLGCHSAIRRGRAARKLAVGSDNEETDTPGHRVSADDYKETDNDEEEDVRLPAAAEGIVPNAAKPSSLAAT